MRPKKAGGIATPGLLTSTVSVAAGAACETPAITPVQHNASVNHRTEREKDRAEVFVMMSVSAMGRVNPRLDARLIGRRGAASAGRHAVGQNIESARCRQSR